MAHHNEYKPEGHHVAEHHHAEEHHAAEHMELNPDSLDEVAGGRLTPAKVATADMATAATVKTVDAVAKVGRLAEDGAEMIREKAEDFFFDQAQKLK